MRPHAPLFRLAPAKPRAVHAGGMKRNWTPLTAAEEFGALHQGMIQAIGYGNLEEALTECAHLADEDFGRNFAAAAGPHSGPWAPRKQGGTGLARGEGHPLEIKSGEMFHAVTSPFGRGHLEDVGYRSAEIGVDPDSPAGAYMFAQNYGTRDGKLPQREFFDIRDETADHMAEIIADAVVDLIAKA